MTVNSAGGNYSRLSVPFVEPDTIGTLLLSVTVQVRKYGWLWKELSVMVTDELAV